MSIMEEIASNQTRWKRGECRACGWIEARPEEEQAEWHQAMADNSFSHSSILRAMRKRTSSEDTPGEGSVGAHRRAGHKAGHRRDY